jgi:hypothetical protein
VLLLLLPLLQGELLAELEGQLYDLRDQLAQAAGEQHTPITSSAAVQDTFVKGA